jgi:hypothetical protein
LRAARVVGNLIEQGPAGKICGTRVGVTRALNHHIQRVFNPDREDHHRGRRKLAGSLTR